MGSPYRRCWLHRGNASVLERQLRALQNCQGTLRAYNLGKTVMTPKNVAIEPGLFERMAEEAAAEGKTADELANEAATRYLALRRLDRLRRYGQRRAEELGITEEDIPRLIAECRAEQR